MFRSCFALIVLMGAAQFVAADVIDGENFIDPTRPLFFSLSETAPAGVDVSGLISNVSASSWDVSFVRASGESPMAVVNSERVTIGDLVGGAEVIGIDRNGVTLLVNNEETRISIFNTALKSQAQN